MLFAVVNESTRVTDADVILMVEAVQMQMTANIAPAWGRVPANLVFFPKGAVLPANAQPCLILDTPDAPNALGYHDEDAHGKVYSKIFVSPVLDNGGVPLAGATTSVVSVASVLSHEVAEQFCDPTCNGWIDGTIHVHSKSYTSVALEVADPVENDGYTVITANGTHVTVSDFVFPAWFDGKAPKGTRFNQLNSLKAPFTMTSGGYLIVRTKPGTTSQVFGESRPAWRALTKSHKESRKLLVEAAPSGNP